MWIQDPDRRCVLFMRAENGDLMLYQLFFEHSFAERLDIGEAAPVGISRHYVCQALFIGVPVSMIQRNKALADELRDIVVIVAVLP